MADEKRTKDTLPEGCTAVQNLIDQNIPINSVPPHTGLFNTRVCRPSFTYNYPPGSKNVRSEGAYIVFGQVPPGGLASGYGKIGIPAESIDLVVGRHSSANDGKGPEDGSWIDNNFGTDAARIYISRLTDIDQAFGLASDPNIKKGRGLIARSGIGIKADGVRIIGREGVRITTGKMQGGNFGGWGEPNSLGGNISMIAPKIDLVAGNNYRDVQGVALGENTRDCLLALKENIDKIYSVINSISRAQDRFNTSIGTACTKVARLADVPTAAALAHATYAIDIYQSTHQSRLSLSTWELNYLNTKFGTASQKSKYIVSPNVRTN